MKTIHLPGRAFDGAFAVNAPTIARLHALPNPPEYDEIPPGQEPHVGDLPPVRTTMAPPQGSAQPVPRRRMIFNPKTRVRLWIVAIGTVVGIALKFVLPASWAGDDELPPIITPRSEVLDTET